MRLLVSCPDCSRQYDATSLDPGSQFHCLCGRLVKVPRPEPHDAAVVRCSACGGPRQDGASLCGFCGADFTLHERDLHTICPGCMTRVSDRARFCHHCASPLLPAAVAGKPTGYCCPSCGERSALSSRSIDDAKIAILECPSCAGIWVGAEEFSLLAQRSRALAASLDGDAESRQGGSRRASPTRQSGPLYRPCPICGKLMNRRNYGRRSGVIVDSCAPHGHWFDSRELESVLLWIRRGGEAISTRRDREDRAAERRHADFKRLIESQDGDWRSSTHRGRAFVDLLTWLPWDLGL